ncbi:MAG TPA: flagellar basal body-associated FliL family protein [Rhizomicrobium sp.]|jgi:flagellar FliL protein
MLGKLFKKKAKAEDAPAEDEDAKKPAEKSEKSESGEGETATEEPKKGFGKKFLLMAGAGALVLLLGIGGGVYYFFFMGSGEETKTAQAKPEIPLTPPQVAYYDVPDIIVNIQTADGSPAYLKVGLSLELDTPEEKAGMQALMPRVVDQFQGYLRELRVDDLKGSAGVMRLKEELLRRINVAASPYQVRDVLLKEMIVQ